MTAHTSHTRRHLIAAGVVLAIGAIALALAAFYPALGPVMGTIAPQMYVDSFAGAQIPLHGRVLLVDDK